ncbi:MAG: iron-sulfur cluster carrier protein ApbC [Gammaproteobacteria bacterium]|nr:iron-sulfur cluster carrier protein ApbC [Gammaproteobacteria bacterium]MDH5629001.1 iron-sulfur cluster carrier protein ApbC [Gammaproteobacteria bacterium]
MLDEQTISELIANSTFKSLPSTIDLKHHINEISVDGDHIKIQIILPIPSEGLRFALADELESMILAQWPQSNEIAIEIKHRIDAYETKAGIPAIPGIKNIIAVASGKGGVGKSTTSVNLALALQKEGAKTGILDADIYGPSIPIMLGIADQRPVSEDQKTILPLVAYDVKAMSIGFLIDDAQAMVWRGPMASSALQQIVRDTRWGDLDYLIVDLPPGTGDIQLTLSQKIPVTAAIIVTTPQDLALADAKKAVSMFEKVNIPVMGVVENMSTHICSQCGHEEAIFGTGGGQSLADKYKINLLGQLPLAMSIRSQLDRGVPALAENSEDEISQSYRQIARQLTANLTVLGRDFSKGSDTIAIKTWSPKQ